MVLDDLTNTDTKVGKNKVDLFKSGRICRDGKRLEGLFDTLKRIIVKEEDSSKETVRNSYGTLKGVNFALRYLKLSDSEEISVSNDSWKVTFSKKDKEYEAIALGEKVPDNIDEVLQLLEGKYHPKERPIYDGRGSSNPFVGTGKRAGF